MKIPASENPYCASFIEYEPPSIASMSPFETVFFMDTECRMVQTWRPAPVPRSKNMAMSVVSILAEEASDA
jgi:hypothetical protein